MYGIAPPFAGNPVIGSSSTTRRRRVPMEIHTTQDRLLRRVEVERRLGVKTTALYAGMRRGTIPQPIVLGPRCIRWSERQLDQRIAELQRAS